MANNLTGLLEKFSKLGIVELDRNNQPIKDEAPKIELTPAEKAIRIGELAKTVTPEQYFQQAPQLNVPVEEVVPPGQFGATNVDLIEQGALNSTMTDMWNSFKKGIDETQKSSYFGKLVDYQEVIDLYPDKKKALESAYSAGQIDQNTYSESLSKLEEDFVEANGKVAEYSKDIEEQDFQIGQSPISKRYQAESAFVQAQGSKSGLWDSFVYTVPETAGSSASLMGQQLAATFGTGVAKRLLAAGIGALAPEPVASKVAAATAFTSALALIANSRREESFAEVGDAVQTAQTELLNRWMEANPGATPTEEDLRQIRLQSYKGKDDLFWQNMSLAGLDLVEAVLLPGSKLKGLFPGGAALEKGLKGIRDYNKYTRMGSYGGAAYADWVKEKFEEGYQYAAQQRQYNEALNLKLYDNKGFMQNIMTDAFDALGSLDYSPIGIVRDAEGRYSHDPNFQFAEGSGGMLAFFGNGVGIPFKAAKDIYLYNKVNKELSKDPFESAADKVFKLKSEILFKHFENGTVHHLVEGLKTLSNHTDEQGNPLLSKEDLATEMGNIAIAADRYQTVNDYINSFDRFFPSKELREQKKALKVDLFDTVLKLSNYESQISKLASEKAKMSSTNSSVGELMDIDSQIQIRQEYIRQLQNETEEKVNPDDAVLYDYDKKLAVLKSQVKNLEKQKTEKLKYLSEEDYKKYTDINLGKDPSKIDAYDPLRDNISIEQENLNIDLVAPTVHRDLYANRYGKYRSMKSLNQATEYIKERIEDSNKKQEIIDKNQPEEKPEVEQTPEENPEAFNEPEGPATEGTSSTSVKKPVTGATAQRVGTLEEHPIVSEFEDAEGFMNYEVVKPDGTTEVVSQKGTWYKTNEIPETDEARVEARHKLYGPDHFMRPFRYNLSKEQAALRKVAKRLNVSVEEVLRKYPEAFPAHANDLLLKKILASPNPKDFIDIVVTDKFSQKNTGYNPIVFSSSTGLVGLRTNGISMLLRLTDPDDTTKQLELFEIYPPDFYGLKDSEGNVVPLDFTDANQINLEKFNTLFVNFGESFTENQFTEFVRNWKAAKDFKTALQTTLKGKDITTQSVVLSKDSYDLSITGEFDRITGFKKPFIKMKDSEFLKNAPIYYFDTDPALSHWVTKDTMTPGYRLKDDQVGYFAAAQTPAGFRWVKLTPGKIVSVEERETMVAKEIKRVVDELYDLNASDLDSAEKAKKIVKSLDFYIASYGDLVITPFAKEQNGRYTLDYSLNKGEAKGHVYMDKFLKNGAEVDYNYKFIKERINEGLTRSRIPDQINENNFRYNVSKDITEDTYEGNIRDLFDATVNPNIVKNLTPKFHLGANNKNVSDNLPPSVTPSSTPDVKPAGPKPVTTPDTIASIEAKIDRVLKERDSDIRVAQYTGGKKGGEVRSRGEWIVDIDAKYNPILDDLRAQLEALKKKKVTGPPKTYTPVPNPFPGESLELQKVLNILEEVKKNKDFIILDPSGDFYVNTNTGERYNRVTSYISDEAKGVDEDLLKSSQAIGNKVDAIIRDYFAGTLKPVNEYELSSKEQVSSLIQGLDKIKEIMDQRNEKVLAHDIVLYNKDLKLAGTVDLLTYDSSGKIRIYDIKTMRGNNFKESYRNDPEVSKYESTLYGKSKKQKHQEQLSIYRILLNNTHGLLADSLIILPVEVNYTAGQVKTNVLNLLKSVNLDPLNKVVNAKIDEVIAEEVSEMQELPIEEEVALELGFNDFKEMLEISNAINFEFGSTTSYQKLGDIPSDIIDLAVQRKTDSKFTPEEIEAARAEREKEIKGQKKAMSYQEEILHAHLGKIHKKDWERYGDRSWSDGPENKGFRDRNLRSSGLQDLDTQVQGLSENFGVEITIQDAIDFITRKETRRLTDPSPLVNSTFGSKRGRKPSSNKKVSLENNNPTLNTPENSSTKEQEEKDREDGAISDAFKIADRGDISYPLTLEEQEEYLSKMLPENFTRKDLNTLHGKVAKNGLIVGAVIDKAIYLRDVADKSDLFHEAFHVVFRNLLSDDRIEAYLNKAASELKYTKEKLEAEKNKLRNSGVYEGYTEQELEDQVYEEYLADNFFEWKKGQEKKSWLRQLFDKIMNLIRFFTTDDVRGLYAAIDRGYFKNSSILKTRYNSKGSTNTTFKLLVGATQIQSADITNQVLAKVIVDGMSVRQALNYFIEFYNPESAENEPYISSNPGIAQEFQRFQNIFLDSANQRILQEAISNKLKSYGVSIENVNQILENLEEAEDNQVDENPEKQWDVTDAYIDPYTRVGRKIKSIMDTTTYTAYFNGKPYQKVLDSRLFYGRMLPVLSVSNLPGEMIMSKLKTLGKWDPQVKAFYERLVELTGYSEDTGELNGVKGKQIYNSLIKAFEVEQMLYFEPVSNMTPGKPITNSVNILNKVDLGKYRVTEWSNYWKTNVLDAILKDPKAKNSILGSINNFLETIDSKSSVTKSNLAGLKSALDKLGIKLEMPYLVYSFGTTEEAEELRESFSLRGMNRDDLIQISRAVSSENDLYGKTTSVNKWGAQGRMLDIANGHAQFDSSLILKTYLDPENKVRYAYVASNMTLAETRRLKTLTTQKAIKEEMAKFNGYYALNPLFTDVKTAINIFSNLNVGLTNNFRTAADVQDSVTKEFREVKNSGITGSEMDSDTMMGVMHILFSSSFKTAATKVKYARYWLSQISDKNTQYAVEMPSQQFWTGTELSEDAKQKLFNLVKQEYLRNKGTYWDYIKKDKFLYFPFLSKDLLQGTMEELESQKDDIINQIEGEFKQLVQVHKKELTEKGLLNGEKFVFLDNELISREYGNLNNYLMNFMLNHFVYTTGVLQFYAGDIAWTKGWDDFVKRMAGAIASGNTLGDQEFINVHATDVIDYLDRSTLEPSTKDAENSVENNSADAQVWSTVYTKKVILDALGELSPNLDSALNKILAGRDRSLTKEERKEFDLISDKLVGYGPDTDGNRQYNKQSTFYLTPGLTSMLDKNGNMAAQPHRVALHNIRTYLEKVSKNSQGILLSPKSANKTYKAPNPVDLRSFENSSEVKTDAKAVTRISGNYLRKQQENDTKTKDNIIFVRQLVDVLGSEIKDPKTRALIEKFREDLAAIRNEAFQFASKLVVNKVGDVYERADLKIWLDSLKHNIEITTPDNQLLEFLSLPEVDLNLPHIQNKTKLMFLNTFKKAFQKKVSGRKATLVSSYGFKVVVDKKTGKIVLTEDIIASKNPEAYTNTDNYEIRDLKIHKIEKDSEGRIIKQEAEVLMTRKTAELRGVNISDPTKEDYMKVFGVRIPLQSYHSTVVGKIVDFLPDYYGDVIVAPKQMVHLGGMDFDVDSLYMFMPNMFINQQGETVMYGKETSDEERFYGFKHFLAKNNNIISQEVHKLLLNNDDFRVLKLEVSMEEDLGEASDSAIIISILNGEVKDKLIRKLTEEALSEVLEKFGYPSTLESFVASGIESEGTVQNRMYTNIHAIMMSEELSEAYKQPANHDKIDKSIAYLEKIGALDIRRKSDVIPNTPVSISNAYTNATQGKNLTGISVNANTVGATLTEYGIKLKDAVSVYFGSSKDDKGNTIPKVYKTFASDPETHRVKADAGSTTVTGTVDNANKPVSRDLNFSKYTLPQRNILIQLGITDYEFIDSFFTLPTLRELVQKLTTSERVLSPIPYSVQMHKDRALLKISSLTGEMKARGEGAGANVNLLEAIKKYKDKINSRILTKEDLEKVHGFTNSILAMNNTTDMSDTELIQALEYYSVQYMAIDLYDQLDHIADYAQHISRIMSLNRRINPDLGFLPEYLESVEELLSPSSPFSPEDIRVLLDNPNVASNLKNVREMIEMSELFFLENTDLFQEMNRRISKNFFARKNETAETRRNFLSFITMKLLKHDGNKSYDSYYQYVIPGMAPNSKTLAGQFNELTKVDTEGKPVKPEFYYNPFVKILEPMMAKDNSASAIDILGIDSRAKFSSDTLDKYMDSIQSMFRSQDKEISEFATNMLKYLIAKDSLQFKNYSFIKLLPATAFAKLAKVLSALNTKVAYKSYNTDAVKDLTGQTSEQLYSEFIELHGRLNPASVSKISLGDTTEDGGSISDNIVIVKEDLLSRGVEKGKYEAFKYKMSESGMTLTQTTTEFAILANLPKKISRFLEHQGDEIFSIEFPSVLSVNGNKAFIYVETSRTKSEGKVTVNYKKAWALNTKGILPYFASIQATEKASALISTVLRDKKKRTAAELETSVSVEFEPEVSTSTKQTSETKETKSQKETITLKDGKEYLPSQINGKMLAMMGYSPNEAGEIIKNLCA